MTDEKRLHGMMADPGPASNHDANGWPAVAPVEFRPGDRVVNTDGDWCTVAEPGMRVAVASDSPSTGTYWADPATLRHLDARLNKPPTNVAGPASSSASPGGTGGLADTAAQLAGSAKDLARLARDVREEMEGRRRELWDLLVEVACEAEEARWEMPALVGNVMGLRSAYRIVTGIGTAALNELLATELDSRYGTDRAKGGEPRG